MNATVPQSFLDEERERDPEFFAREYSAEFRDAISSFFTRESVEACIVPGRKELPYVRQFEYVAGVDPSGGGPDAFTLSICHPERDGELVVQDAARAFHSRQPETVVQEMAALLRSYRCSAVVGDRYSGQWVQSSFRTCGIYYEPSEISASEAFLELLPSVNQRTIELLDDPAQTKELIALERRKGRNGKDSVGHPVSGHDDRVAALALAHSKARQYGYLPIAVWQVGRGRIF